MKKAIFTALIIVALGHSAALAVHDDPTRFRCLDCHVHVPLPDRPGGFYDDMTSLCAGCHTESHASGENSHPVNVVPSMKLPPDLPLDRRGRINCLTCHYFHKFRSRGAMLDNPLMLRRPVGRNFCMACHARL